MRGATVSFRFANFSGTGRFQVFGDVEKAAIRIVSESFDGINGTMRIIDFMSQEDTDKICLSPDHGPSARFTVSFLNRILEDIEKKPLAV